MVSVLTPAREVAAPRGRWIALAVVLTASFIQLLDASITNVAIPAIQRDLGATDAEIQLVLAAYTLPYAACLILGGRLGDVFGRRRLFLIGVAGFAAASLLCGLARTGVELDLARAVQGLTAALMLPQVLAVIQVTFPREAAAERARAFGFYGMVLSLPWLLGPFVGGLLVQADLFGWSWRPIFLINVPICLAACALGVRYLPESVGVRRPGLDVGGVVLIVAALVSLVVPLIAGREAGWPLWTAGAFCLSAVLFAAWWRRERRLTRSGGSPLVPTTMFADRAFRLGLLISFVTYTAFTPAVLFFTVYLQTGMGYSPLAAGLTALPFALGTVFASVASAPLSQRLGARVLTAGAAVLGAGTVLLYLTVTLAARPMPSGWLLAPSLLICGAGLGLIAGPLANTVLGRSGAGPLPGGDEPGEAGEAGDANAGAASGVLNNVDIGAGAVGVGLLGVVFYERLDAGAGAAGYADAFGLVVLATLAAYTVVLCLTVALWRSDGRSDGRS